MKLLRQLFQFILVANYKVVNELAEGTTGAHKDLAGLDTGVNTVSDIEKDNTDRKQNFTICLYW